MLFKLTTSFNQMFNLDQTTLKSKPRLQYKQSMLNETQYKSNKYERVGNIEIGLLLSLKLMVDVLKDN